MFTSSSATSPPPPPGNTFPKHTLLAHLDWALNRIPNRDGTISLHYSRIADW